MSQDRESFRDSIGTIEKSTGKRKYIFPKKPKGKFYKYRKYVSGFLLTILIVSPFVKIDGNQLFLFNVIERKFLIFGMPFWPQDFYLLVISMILGIIFITIFTVVFGRIFCGWICPQTIFMEMVFRRIEYWIEGDRPKQMKLKKQPWNAEKIRKRLTKWSVFFLISFIISNVFLAYTIGSDEVLVYISSNPLEHLGILTKLLIFTGVFYFIFAWFREQVCIIVCPYGRLQGVLLDSKSINVAYDFIRGEGKSGRKKIRKGEEREKLGHGDCIECKQCVHVCPTGIDIRNGTQLECINCTACIDACDSMMDKVGFKKGLIRYASEDAIKKSVKFKFTARLKAYTVVLLVLVTTLTTLLFLRTDVEATILSLRGQSFQNLDEKTRNIYTLKLINKTTDAITDIELKLISHEGLVEVVGNQLSVEEQFFTESTLFVIIDNVNLKSHKEKIKIGFYKNEKLIETATTNFISAKK